MILSQPDLRKAVDTKQVIFDPSLDENQWGEASVNLRLGFGFTILEALPGFKVSIANGLGGLGKSGFWKTVTLKEFDEAGQRPSFLLRPTKFVLGMTHERIVVPRNLIALVEGRSTYARVGLSMHQTASWIQPGWDGPIVLEIMNNGTLDIELTPLIDRPCQLTFFQLSKSLPKNLSYGYKPSDAYQGRVIR